MNLISLLSLLGRCEAKSYSIVAQFFSRVCEPLQAALPREEICSVETKKRHLAFDGSSIYRGGGTGVVPYDPDGTDVSLSLS